MTTPISVQESNQAEVFSPKARVARIRVKWLEDGAISANGRQYPKEAVDRLVQSAQIALSDTNSAPLTCYISHSAADQDNTLELVGKLASVWKENTQAFAFIDIPDTRAGRDIASLAVGGYLKTESLRAENAKITHDRSKGIPQVGGEDLRLVGIDFTTTPGISTAHIQNVILETDESDHQKISETFELSSQAITLDTEKGLPMKPKETLNETVNIGGALPSMSSGDSQSVTNDPTQDGYGKTMYKAPVMTSGDMQGQANVSDLQEAVKQMHDHSAAVLGMGCAPSDVAAQEAGKALSAANRKHIVAMHNKSAQQLNMPCNGNASDNMQDGDDDSQPSNEHKETTVVLNEAQQLEALRKAGYTIQAPKSENDLLKERLAAQDAQMAELREMITKGVQVNEAAPQRRSYVMGASTPHKVKSPASHLQEQVKGLDLNQLADRTCPLPDGIALEHLIKWFTDMRIVENFEQFGYPDSIAREMGVY